MTAYSLTMARSKLRELVEKAQAGEEVVVEHRGEPAVRLVPVSQSRARRIKPAIASLKALVMKQPVGKAVGTEIVRAMRDDERF